MTKFNQDKHCTDSNYVALDCHFEFLFICFQRLLRMVDGLNFKDFVAFLSTFSAKASLRQKIERNP